MGKTSEHWTSLERFKPDCDHVRRVKHVLESVNIDHLCSVAVDARRAQDSSGNSISHSQEHQLSCTIDTSNFAVGFDNLVFEIEFSDSTEWIARMRLPVIEPKESDGIETSMMSEITTMRYIALKTTIPIPKVFSFDLDPKNPVGFRYILMEALPGHHPTSGLASSVPRERWDKPVDQLADYLFQLSQLRFDSIGRLWLGRNADRTHPTIISIPGIGGPFRTSWEYFRSLRKSHSRSIRTDYGDNDPEWNTSAWVLEQAVSSMIVDEWIHGPFLLCHMDFHYNNILIDDDYNITGIIDWSHAQTVPLERFTVTPEFVTFPGLSAEKNEPMIAFRRKVATALKAKDTASSPITRDSQALSRTAPPSALPSSPRMLVADVIDTPLWEIIYRSTYSYYWRAKTDARMVLAQMYGKDAKWEDFVSYYVDGPINHMQTLVKQKVHGDDDHMNNQKNTVLS